MENKILLKIIEEKLEKHFKYKKGRNTIDFYNQELKKYDELGCLILNGDIISLEEVYRHNATNENKSCRVSIYKWNNNRGTLLNQWKINCKASDKKIDKIIEEVVNEYKKLESEI